MSQAFQRRVERITGLDPKQLEHRELHPDDDLPGVQWAREGAWLLCECRWERGDVVRLGQPKFVLAKVTPWHSLPVCSNDNREDRSV